MTRSNEKTVIGVTGGIASGKSTVAQMLRELGATVIDADDISRELTGANGRALPDIRAAFGESVFTKEGALNRRALADRVFSDAEALERLNAILHPMIRSAIRERIDASESNVTVLDAPLLFEADMRDMVDKAWLCYCPEETQIIRATQRDGITREQAIARIRSQWRTQKKLRLSDASIDTSVDTQHTRRQVEALWARLTAQGDSE